MAIKLLLILILSLFLLGGCQSNISVSGGQNVCYGQDFNLTCQFACHGLQNHVKLVKEQQIECRKVSSDNSITLSMQVHGANRNHSGTYSCQTEPEDSISMAYVRVEGKCEILSAHWTNLNWIFEHFWLRTYFLFSFSFLWFRLCFSFKINIIPSGYHIPKPHTIK